jgi:hypothetical protein
MQIKNRISNHHIPLFVVGFVLISSSCIPQKRPEVPKSEVNNSAMRDLVTSGSNMFLDYVRKTGSTEVMSKSVTLTTPFVKSSTSGEWKTDAELLLQIPSPSVKTEPIQQLPENDSPSVTCSSWFDSFLRGDQASITVKEPGGNKDYLLQFKLCESPEKGEVNSEPGFFVSFLQNCAKLLKKDKIASWTMYRTLPIQAHAFIVSRAHLQECTAWTRKIDFVNLMGLQVHHSYTRECRLRCDSVDTFIRGPSINYKGKACPATAARAEWREFAEFPDAELAAKTKQQGAASCNFGDK